VLVRLVVQFHSYMESSDIWPPIGDASFNDMLYEIDSVLIHVESFRVVMHSYGILVGATRSTVDWRTIDTKSLRGRFLSTYKDFVRETKFERKCRLLLDLFKVQIVLAGVLYDCIV
jgi:hypothetical protein